jgi:pantetheine-phosphate adenylyltransferase
MKALSADLPNVSVSLWDGLIVSFAEQHGIRMIVRGVRALSDFDYEFELAAMNRSLNPRVETILIPTDQKYSVLRSSVVKDIARFGGTVNSMVPPIVAEALQRKLGPPGGRHAGAPKLGMAPGDS